MPAESLATACHGSRLAASRPCATPLGDLGQLLHRISRNDEAALRALYEATSAKLNGLARAMLGNAADAEEVVCEAYVQAWQSASRFDPERGSVLGWLLMICRSRALDLLRQRRARAAADVLASCMSETDPVPAPEELLYRVQSGTAIHRALRELSPLRRQLVALAFLRGMSHQEIARAASLPIGTVKSHLRRALLGMRTVLDVGA
jgi:RNA polymerase sigma-70 factor (ECF subfamily)